jgi:hypothetical protein
MRCTPIFTLPRRSRRTDYRIEDAVRWHLPENDIEPPPNRGKTGRLGTVPLYRKKRANRGGGAGRWSFRWWDAVPGDPCGPIGPRSRGRALEAPRQWRRGDDAIRDSDSPGGCRSRWFAAPLRRPSHRRGRSTPKFDRRIRMPRGCASPSRNATAVRWRGACEPL